MVDILDEAIQDIKDEKVERLFFKYLKFLIALLVISLVVWVCYYGYKNYKENKIFAVGGEYLIGIYKLQSKDVQKGTEIMERLAAGEVSYSALAGLNYASYLVAKQDFAKASQVYKMVADNKDFEKIFRDFSHLQYILMRLNSKEINSKQGIVELDEYIKKDNAYKASALEQKAALYLALNDKKNAKETLESIITSADAPKLMKRRDEELLVLATS